MNNQKVWFITGASKGIGLALTNYLLSQGYAVAATSRSVVSLEKGIMAPSKHLLPLEVDITTDSEVKSAIEKTVERFGRIDVVVNNAGYSLVGSFNVHVTIVAPGQFRTNFMNSDSMLFVKNRIDVYGIEEAQKMWSNYSGQQIGDPEKLVRIFGQISEMETPPKRLLLGPDTYELVLKQFQTTLEEFEQWKDITFSTNFD